MQVQYKIAGFHSPLANVFYSELNDSEKQLFNEPLKRFESASLLSAFEDALLVFPFKIEDEHKKKLKRIHAYNRQIAVGQIAEEMLFQASTSNKNSLPAAQLMLEALIKGALPEIKENRLIINVPVKLTEGSK